MYCHIANKLSVNSLCENLHDDTTERESKLGGGQKHTYEEKCLGCLFNIVMQSWQMKTNSLYET